LSWLAFSEVFGDPLPLEALVKDIARYGFRESLVAVAQLLAVALNSDGGPRGELARQLTTGLLATFAGSPQPHEAKVARFAKANADRAIVHEQVAYTLLALVILHGADTRDAPPPAKVAFWLLAANDHLPAPKKDVRALSDVENAVAEFWWHSRFNWGSHLKRDLVRGGILFESAPARGPLAKHWRELQELAFGMPYEAYVSQLGGLLFLLSTTWGVPIDAGKLRSPIVRLADLGWDTPPHRRFFEERTWTRAEARAVLGNADSLTGVPRDVGAFLEHPFLQVGDELIVVSPSGVREALRLSAWGALRAAEIVKSGRSKDWLPTFGEMVETWCRLVAGEASAGVRAANAEVILPDSIGDGSEIEDVILSDGGRAILFSVKGTLAPRDIGKLNCSRSDIIEWLQRFLFAEPDKSRGQRGGALRLLNSKVEALRGGRLEPRVDRNASLVPTIVSFEHLGDNLALYSWIEQRCQEEGLLQQPQVRPVSLLTVAEYELVMSLAARGADVLWALSRWPVSSRLLTVERLLMSLGKGLDFEDLPFFSRAFDTLWAKVAANLEMQVARRAGVPSAEGA
jgi:hypothetical protein